MLTYKVVCQVVDVEILEEQAFGQPPEVAFQLFDDFQRTERIDPQLTEWGKRVEIKAQRSRRLANERFEIRLGQVLKWFLMHHSRFSCLVSPTSNNWGVEDPIS